MIRNQKAPNVGDTLFVVNEHLYHVEGKAAPRLEYCVCIGKVKKISQLWCPEVCVVGNGPDGHKELWYYKVSEIGTKVFYTAHEAAMLAKEKSDEYDRKFFWNADVPIRRTWEKYLHGEII